MDGILALGHFCESHGPCVILCTQRSGSPPEQQGPHTLTVPWCDSCQSVYLEQALISRDSNGCYVTTRTPLQQDLAFLLRQAAVRSLSCEEETSGEGAPIYFGDNERGHVLGHTFTLQDSLARGFHRKYTILMLMRDKVHLLNAWPMLVKHIKEIVRDLKKAAETINGAEQVHRSQRAVRQAQGSPGTVGRSLSQLTGRPAVFAHLHLWFSWLLSRTLAEEKPKIPVAPLIIKPSTELRPFFNKLGEDVFTIAAFCVLTGANLVTVETQIMTSLKTLLPFDIVSTSNKYCTLVQNDSWTYEFKEGLPVKLPVFVTSVIKALKDVRLPNSVLSTHLSCLVTQWKNTVNSMSWTPTINIEFLQSLGVQRCDLPLLLFWVTGLCKDGNKQVALKEQLNRILGRR